MSPSESVHGILVIDKARGPTSHDVVNVARRVLGTKAIGHTGTLDPMATGVLVLAVGEATKLVNQLGALEKSYRATIRLGVSTHTLDAEGEVDGEATVPPLDRVRVEAAAQRFLGEINQRAPNVSAIKVDGKSLYKRARSGQVFEAPIRRVRLDAITIDAVREAEIDLSLTCGPGFYVRSLARDLAASLGTLGHLTMLRRTRNGRFSVDEAVDFEALRAARAAEALRAPIRERVIPLSEICRGLPHLTLDAAGVTHARCGRAIPLTHVLSGVPHATQVAFDEAGTPIALVERIEEQLRVARGFVA